MPWRETCMEQERESFVLAVLGGEMAMSRLCAVWGISRSNGYKWLRRYQESGRAGLRDRSRAPQHHGRAMPAEVTELLMELRRRRPHWGPRKLRVMLGREHPQWVVPAASTIGDLLRRHGLSLPRSRRRRRLAGEGGRGVQAGAPNAVWCADFKGHFRTRDGARCDPLTISDGYSRYLIDCHLVARLTTLAVRERFLRAFAEHGMPEAIHTDNAVPFAGSGVAGLSRLAVEWVKAGITLERSRPGHPQDNGRHERMHRTLKAETASPPATDRVEQQRRCDRFRAEYNCERPHQALGQLTPAALYQPSARRWPARLEDPWYDADHQVRRVRREGAIKWKGRAVFISEALSGELLGIRELPWGDYLVRFANLELGLIRPGESRLRRSRAHTRLHPDVAFLLPQLSSIYPV